MPYRSSVLCALLSLVVATTPRTAGPGAAHLRSLGLEVQTGVGGHDNHAANLMENAAATMTRADTSLATRGAPLALARGAS